MRTAARGVVFVLQAMDAAGKDSTIKHAMASLNPQGVDVVSFKQPSQEELAHDYLWRAVRAAAARENSHFQPFVLRGCAGGTGARAAKHIPPCKAVPARRELFEKRYEQIRNFEEYLYENSYRVVKMFLNVSKEEQKKRFWSA